MKENPVLCVIEVKELIGILATELADNLPDIKKYRCSVSDDYGEAIDNFYKLIKPIIEKYTIGEKNLINEN